MSVAMTTNRKRTRKERSRLLSWYAGYSMLRGSLATILFGAFAIASLRTATAGSEAIFVWGMALFSAFRTLVAGGLLARQAWAYTLEILRQILSIALSIVLATVPAAAGLLDSSTNASGAISGLGSSFIGAAFGLLIVAWLMSRRHEFQV